jgi:DNA-binding beta-propeller fold protein YncE
MLCLMARFPISLKGLLAFAAVAASMAAFAASAGAAPLVYMLNAKSVTTLDAATNQLIGSAIPTGEDPEGIAITPNGKRAFVVNFVGNSVTVIETASRAPVATLPLPSNGERIAISPDGKTAYATSESKEKVVVISTETATETGTITVGPEASALAFAPNGKQAYVGIAPEDVQVVDTATGKLVGGPIKVAGFVRQIAFTPSGETAYVAAGNGVAVINTALGMVTGEIPVPSVSTLAVSPDGKRVYAASKSGKSVTVAETGTNKVVGSPIPLPSEPVEIAITPDGGTAYVADGLQVTPINLATNKAATPLSLSGVFHLVAAPDQSPTAAFTSLAPIIVAPDSFTSSAAFVGSPVTFSGAASTDPDGSVAAWNWNFGDGATASGVSATHTYGVAGTYNASLNVTDNEGCGEAEVFTGRTAYCSGNPLAKATHPVETKVPPVVCSSRFRFGRLIHNRRNGTVRVQVKVPAAGSIYLFGKKIHAVKRKAKAKGSLFLTLHARVEVNKRLKKVHHTGVRYRITFYPEAGCSPTTVHRSVALLRKPARKKHHHR